MIVRTILCGAIAVAAHAESGQFLKAGEIMPQGWMKEQLRLDLEEGYLPHYGEVNHTVTHNVFVHQNRISQQQYFGLRCWWSGEHEGYWKDAILRMAFLSGDEKLKAQAITWLDEILAAQGSDGYIGVYKAGDEPNHRFKHTGENGELWVQSRIFQALIAGYEFTGREEYLTAVKKAVDCSIKNDPGNYFVPEKKAKGGVTHAVGFFDALWYLHAQTGEQKYADYAIKLYEDFDALSYGNNDLQLKKLLSKEKFSQHGAHIAEGFFIPAYIASLTDDEKFDRAADQAVKKLKYHLTPSGAMVCAEHVWKKPGSGDEGYEYCGIAELVQALTKMVAINGDPEMAEMAETMTLNAGQGARFPVLTALSYVATDNRLEAYPKTEGQRYAYAAFHKAAACCSLNGGRLLPYYIEGMWIRGEDSLTAQLYGPCTVNTTVGGVALNLQEETNYPFEDSIRFSVDPAKPLPLKLRFRIPKDAADLQVSGVDGARKEDGYVVIDRTWKKGDSFTLTFDFPVKTLHEVADSKEAYLKRGPLVYALPIKYSKKVSPETYEPVLKENGEKSPNVLNPESGFHVYEIKPTDQTGWDYRLPKNAKFKLVNVGGDPLHPFADSPIKLKGTMLDEEGKVVETSLIPIGCTVLRRTTFPEVSGE